MLLAGSHRGRAHMFLWRRRGTDCRYLPMMLWSAIRQSVAPCKMELLHGYNLAREPRVPDSLDGLFPSLI